MSLSFDLDDLRVFCLAARKASFSGAATELGASPAFVSKRIAILEKALGVRLFHRSARRVSITADGERVYASAQQVFESVEQMAETVASGPLDLRGTLRVTTSFRFGRLYLGPALSRLAQRHPGLAITLDAGDRRVDLIGESVDLDVRIGDVDEPQLVAHPIVSGVRMLFASPAYLERRGLPTGIAELSRHECLVLRDRHQAFGVWRLTGLHGMETVKVTGRLASNDGEIVRGWALAGHGILLAAEWDAFEDVQAGRLARVLPGCAQPADVRAVSSVRLSHSAKVRACVRFLQEELGAGGRLPLPRLAAPGFQSNSGH